MNTRVSSGVRRKVRMERTFRASIEEVWDLWTTKEGLESWWGPDGFAVTVRKIDLRPGGELLYAMTAVAPEQIAFLKNAGMPIVTESRATYREITPPRRLAYDHDTDFIAGVEPYNVATLIELEPTADGVRMVLTFDAMHAEEWTKLAVMGWEMELGKLERLLAA